MIFDHFICEQMLDASVVTFTTPLLTVSAPYQIKYKTTLLLLFTKRLNVHLTATLLDVDQFEQFCTAGTGNNFTG